MATMSQAIRMALHRAETEMGVMDIFGEDVGAPLGGVFACTQGLERAWNSPLDERGILGTAMGLAMAGQKPVAEIQFCDYIFNSIDLLKLAGNSLWITGGQFPMPMVVMTPSGAGIHGSPYHSHSFDGWATRLPGWKVVMPSDAKSAYGLMLSAVEDPNPVLYLIPKALIRTEGGEPLPGEPDKKTLRGMIDAPIGDRTGWKPSWPAIEPYFTPIGRARIARVGGDVTVVTYGRHVAIAETAARILDGEGCRVEVIDLLSLLPYDWDTVSASIRKTGRVLFLNEDTEITNFGEHLLRRAVEDHWYSFRARPRVLAGQAVPGIGMADAMETASVPQLDDVVKMLRDIVQETP